MKQKTMILIALAVVCGLGASFMTSKLLADRATQDDTVKVLVAKKSLATGIIIKNPEESFEEKDVPKETAPANALKKFDEVKGRQMKIPRRPGDTITLDDMYSDKGSDLMYLLPPGHRAVGVRVSSEQIAAGFAAVPHSRIDIACAVRTQSDNSTGTRIVLQNVLVLASGQQTVRDDGGKAMLCDVVTVALTPEDACKLETIKGKGSLTMFLRPFGDNARVDVGLVTVDRAFAKPGSDKVQDEDAPKSGTGAPVVGFDIPPANQGPVKLQEEPKPAVNDKHVIRITNGDAVEKRVYEKDGDGLYSSRADEPVTNTTSGSAKPTVRSAKQPSAVSPAPAAPTKQ